MAIDLSEAYLFYCIAEAQQNRACDGANGGWWPDAALDALRDNGVPDDACFPYTAGDQPCNACADVANRLTRIAAWTQLGDLTAMKSWIAQTGPVVTTLSVYEDFGHYGPDSGVYQHVTGALLGGHCVCVVGYDDGKQCWIIKNSWDTTWGDEGFGLIEYGQVGIDALMYGIRV